MKKIHWILLIITLTLVGSTAAFLFQIKGNQKLGKPGVRLGKAPLFDEQTNQVAEVSVILPEDVSGYSSTPVPISDIELQMLPKDTTYGKRRYRMTNDAIVDLSVVLMGQDRTSIHKPQFCLVGQGWTIEKSEQVSLPMTQPYRYELPMMKLTASIRIKDQNGNPMIIHGIYVYWFVADNKITASDDRMWSTIKNFLRTGTLERWAYISYFSHCLPGQEDETFDRMREFIARSVPAFQLAPGAIAGTGAQAEIQTAFK